jgi:acetoin utilization deacetylase AcuC-like enzyme
VLLVHKNTSDWVSEALREAGAEVVEGAGGWDAVRLAHSEIFVKAVSRREADVLRAVAVADAALSKRRAVFYVGGTSMAGLHTPRGGHVFNATVYIAKKVGASVLSIDRHFPLGTWELHLEHKFPLYVVYGGAEGPSHRQVARRGHGAVAFPLPPGAGDRSFERVLSFIDRTSEGPLAVQLGFDIHRDDPTGYFFASERFYYLLGRALARREFYISLECPSTPGVFKRALASLLAGVAGGEAPAAEPYRESEAVRREVELLLRRARRIL